MTNPDQFSASLIVRRVDAIPVQLPLKKPVQMASETIHHAKNILVRVEAENGLVGWGEAASGPTMTGETQASMVAAVEQHLGPVVVGCNALDRGILAQRLLHRIHLNGGAKAAIEIALNDLVGRHLGVSVTDLFGGPIRETIEPMCLIGNPDPDDDVAEAVKRRDEGFRVIKLKCGSRPVDQDIAVVRAVREKLGGDIRLCADANMGMSKSDALAYANGVADCRIDYLEQPLRAEDLDGMAALARLSPVPLGGDECIGSLTDILVYRNAGAVAGVNLKTIKCGGIAETRRIATICDGLGLSIKLACKVAESSIGAAALTHLGYTIENLDWGISLSNVYLAEDLTVTSLLPEDGKLVRLTGPGLGVEVDESAVERARALT